VTEIERRRDICIILVQWGPPANSDASDVNQYIVYIPSRNIRDISSSTISTLMVSNCGNDTRIQVAAVNRAGCVGMNSSEVQAVLLDLPTEDGSASKHLKINVHINSKLHLAFTQNHRAPF
jgi:hypothetical protein